MINSRVLLRLLVLTLGGLLAFFAAMKATDSAALRAPLAFERPVEWTTDPPRPEPYPGTVITVVWGG
jgi:hypothetical protein